MFDQGGLFPLRSWDCPVASPGFAELLDELDLRMEVFPFSAFFDYFLLFRFWPLLPKEILFLLNGQHKPASPLNIFCSEPPRIAVVSHVCSPIFNPKEAPRRPKGVQERGGDPYKNLFD